MDELLSLLATLRYILTNQKRHEQYQSQNTLQIWNPSIFLSLRKTTNFTIIFIL